MVRGQAMNESTAEHSHPRAVPPPPMNVTSDSVRSNDRQEFYDQVVSSERGASSDEDEIESEDGFADFIGAEFDLGPPPPPFGTGNTFNTTFAGRPLGLQGGGQQQQQPQPELGMQWLSAVKNVSSTGNNSKNNNNKTNNKNDIHGVHAPYLSKKDDAWHHQVQEQKYMLEELNQQRRQEYLDRESERSQMSRTDHRHALQQLVVEAFRWRRAATDKPPASPELDDLESSTDVRMGVSQTTAPSPDASTLTSPRMKPTASVESLCGLTAEEEDDDAMPVPVSANGATVGGIILSPRKEEAPFAASLPSTGAVPATSPTSAAASTASSTASTLSACNRQLWRKRFPLPDPVPAREKADHTTSPLDVGDRGMLYGVLDDIDSVMTSSDVGEDGLPKDRYTEVLANLQFLGLYRPKYADGVHEDDHDEDDGLLEDGEASLRDLDLDLDEGDHGDGDDGEGIDGLVELLSA